MPSKKTSVKTKSRSTGTSKSRVKITKLSIPPITEAEIALTAYGIYEERVRTGRTGSPEEDWISALAILEQHQ